MNKNQRIRLAQMRLEDYERRENNIKLESIKENKQEKVFKEEIENSISKRYTHISKNTKYNNWLKGIKESLVFDTIMSIYSEAFSPIKTGAADEKYDGLRHSLVEQFVKSHSDNIDGFINKMKHRSEMLSEIAVLIEETVSAIKKDVNPDDESSYILDTSIKDDFFDKLNMIKPENVIYTIRHRVSDAVEDFINQNTIDKIEIAEIMKQAKERIDVASSDTMKEACEIQAKRKISEIHDRQKDLLSSMVYNLSEAAYKNENLSKFKNTNGTIDMDTVVETCEVMYTFLETVSTTRLAEFNEEDIKQILDNLKK